MQSSPGTPRGTTRPVSGSTIFTSTCGCTRPTVETRRSMIVVRRGLRGDRRRLRHPVADRDLRHVHLADHALHHLDRARRAGHDAGPQRREVVAGEVGQAQLGDEHRRHAVQRRAPLLLHGAQRRGRLERPARGSRCRRRASSRPGCRAPSRSSDRRAPGCTPGRPAVYRHPSPMKKPLFRMLWCDRVAPLGKPVVPLVYWMLIGSSKDRLAPPCEVAVRAGCPPRAASAPAATSSSQSAVPR